MNKELKTFLEIAKLETEKDYDDYFNRTKQEDVKDIYIQKKIEEYIIKFHLVNDFGGVTIYISLLNLDECFLSFVKEKELSLEDFRDYNLPENTRIGLTVPITKLEDRVYKKINPMIRKILGVKTKNIYFLEEPDMYYTDEFFICMIDLTFKCRDGTTEESDEDYKKNVPKMYPKLKKIIERIDKI